MMINITPLSLVLISAAFIVAFASALPGVALVILAVAGAWEIALGLVE